MRKLPGTVMIALAWPIGKESTTSRIRGGRSPDFTVPKSPEPGLPISAANSSSPAQPAILPRAALACANQGAERFLLAGQGHGGGGEGLGVAGVHA